MKQPNSFQIIEMALTGQSDRFDQEFWDNKVRPAFDALSALRKEIKLLKKEAASAEHKGFGRGVKLARGIK
jgi:hypothetical protein